MTRRAACAENRLGLVDKKEWHEIFAALLASRGKDLAHHSFRFAHPHVQNLRAFDVHKIFLHFHACFFAKLFRQIVGRRFADECLAATWRAVEQETFRCSVLKFFEKIAMQQWKLYRVVDRLEGYLISAYSFPRQIGHVS